MLGTHSDRLTIGAFPAPGLLLLELPFWTILLLCALVPGSKVPWLEWQGVPVRSSEALVVAAAVAYFGAWTPRHLGRASGDTWKVTAPLLIAVAYATASLYWSSVDDLTHSAMLVTLAFAIAPAVLAASLIGLLPRGAASYFLWRLTICLAILSLLYTAESILSLGFRTEASRALISDFGIDRVRGPLYGSATGYVALLPALGLAVEHAVEPGPRKWMGRFLVVAFLTAILGMGSRAGLLLLGGYLLALVCTLQRFSRKVVTFAVFGVLGVVAAMAVFSRANPDRLRSFEDSGRQLTHRMAWNYLRSEPVSKLALGAGYGAIWPWYLRDSQAGERVAAGDNLTWTQFGPSLYHSHSTGLQMAVELGLTGAATFVLQLWLIAGFVRQARRQARWPAYAAALAVASLGFFFDLFLFKNTTVNLVWWLYAVGLAKLLREDRETSCDSG
jgi:hypothetical protein